MTVFMALFVLNVIDLVSTMFVIKTGIGYEANPIMAFFLELGDIYFITVKLGMAGFGTWFLYINRDLPIAQKAVVLLTVIYSLLILWHGIVYLQYLCS